MLEGGGHDGSSARRVRAARRRGRRRLLLACVGLVLLALAALFGRRLLEPGEEPAAGEPAPPPAARVPSAPRAGESLDALAPEQAPIAAEPLPPLADSDAFVRERAAGASTRPELSKWLAGEGLVARFVAAVDNVANGESPRANLPELAPHGPFRATSRSGGTFVDARSGSRYDVAAAVFASLDPDACARLHALLLPLFEEAYAELGRPEGSFDDLLARAFRELLDTPVPDGPVALVPRLRSYHFADPALEALSPAQKQLLRMGPGNERAVQAKLRELAAALGLDLERPSGAGPAR